jgi:TonB family protein
MPNWKQCEGQLAGGTFPLQRYLGGGKEGAVFLTWFGSGRAAIKLVPAGLVQAGELVKRWNRAAGLRHPHLACIFAAGTWAFDGTPLAYVITEYAEENLAEVLRDRPLTTDETREMLLPVADALAYLHGQGLVHGNLKPSNILAVEDTVKISSEAVSTGDPAADIRALGETLVQVFTREAATAAPGGQNPAVDALPHPFQELAQNCLHHDPRLRWSAGKIGAWLRSAGLPASTLPGQPRRRSHVAAITLVVAGAAIVGGLVMHRTSAPAPSAADLVRPAPASAPPGPAPPGQSAAPKVAPTGIPAAQDEITRRVIPEIPAKARNTVHGKATVVVTVTVDPAGNVTEATLERGGSPYFGRLAREAALHWQFAPVQEAGPRNWILRFEIRRTSTRVIPRKADRK